MLSVTPTAAELIAALALRAELPEGGLRIAQHGERPGLTMAMVPAPREQDLVLLAHDVAVFLDPAAAERLAEDVLDARRTPNGAAFFLD